MTRTATEPTLTGQILALIRRVTNLERKVDKPTAKIDRTLIFSEDPLGISTSGPDWFTQGATIYEFEIGLSAAVSGATTASVLVNGSSVGSLSVPSGDTRARGQLTVTVVNPNHDVKVDVTAIGTGDCLATFKVYGR